MALDSYLLSLPPELRLIIYEFVIDTSPGKVLNLRNMTEIGDRLGPVITRSAYNITVQCGKTRENLRSTYARGPNTAALRLEIMRVNRLVYAEVAAFLYSTHVFDFGRDIEAVVPFLCDRSRMAAGGDMLIREIRLTVRGPIANASWMSDQSQWKRIYRHLEMMGALETLTIVDEGVKDTSPREWVESLPEVGVARKIEVLQAPEEFPQYGNFPVELSGGVNRSARSRYSGDHYGLLHKKDLST